MKLLDKKGESADDARKTIFKHTCGIGINLANVPCTSDALYQHTLRVHAQTYIWKNAIFPRYWPIDLTQYGYYKSENGALLPKLMTKNPLPENLIKPCNCRKTCKTKACNCKKNNVNCIPLCGCDEDFCENKHVLLVSQDECEC